MEETMLHVCAMLAAALPTSAIAQGQMPMGDMPFGMMIGMGLVWLLVLVFLLVGIAAGIKYLRS
jgi:hypothetical protein